MPNVTNIPSPIIGVTSDDVVSNLKNQKKALQLIGAKGMPTIRIVLELWQDPKLYLEAVKTLHGVEGRPRIAYVMCEVADSDYLWRFNDEHKDNEEHSDLLARLHLFLDVLGDYVDAWEVGNEVNGEWAGWKGENGCEKGERDYVEARMAAVRQAIGHQIVDVYKAVKTHPKSANADTVLTLYFYTNMNKQCWPDRLMSRDCDEFHVRGEDYEMLNWLGANLYTHPDAVDFHPTHVLLSVYEDDCRDDDCNDLDLSPAMWVEIFEEIQGAFQDSLVGFGEVGTHCRDCKNKKLPRNGRECVELQRANVRKHYSELHHNIGDMIKKDGRKINYAGGYFYWFFTTDMVKKRRTDPDRKPALEELLVALDGWV
jgi:hypothetical protein